MRTSKQNGSTWESPIRIIERQGKGGFTESNKTVCSEEKVVNHIKWDQIKRWNKIEGLPKEFKEETWQKGQGGNQPWNQPLSKGVLGRSRTRGNWNPHSLLWSPGSLPLTFRSKLRWCCLQKGSQPPALVRCPSCPFFKIYYLFIWLCQVSVVVQQDLGSSLWHAGSSSLTRNQTRPPLTGTMES